MRLRNIPGAREEIATSDYCLETPTELKGKWNTRFGNDHPLYIEIGMGKGRFITDNARLFPDINFIGIEKYSSVLLRAVQKLEETGRPGSEGAGIKSQDSEATEIKPQNSEAAASPGINNLLFIRMEAEYIDQIFAPGEVDRIYLNFSDPWPKARNAKRRLPSKEFLQRYTQILKTGGCVEFKTDNRELFDFAVEEAGLSGWEMPVCTYDLHADPVLSQGNIMTEYEEKFSSMGNPICKYIILNPGGVSGDGSF